MTTKLETPGPRFGHRDPDVRGYFGEFGGRFVPETLMAPVDELTTAYFEARQDRAFQEELRRLLTSYVGPDAALRSPARDAWHGGTALLQA